SFLRSKAGITALLAVSATFLAAGAALHQVNERYLRPTSVNLSLQNWKWMSEVKVGVASPGMDTFSRAKPKFRRVALLKKIPRAPKLLAVAAKEPSVEVIEDRIEFAAA